MVLICSASKINFKILLDSIGLPSRTHPLWITPSEIAQMIEIAIENYPIIVFGNLGYRSFHIEKTAKKLRPLVAQQTVRNP